MTPGSFDPSTAREVVGDSTARRIEAAARSDADAGARHIAESDQAMTYWGQVQQEMQRVVYEQQYAKRTARNQRQKATA